jgi:hypothetical protein
MFIEDKKPAYLPPAVIALLVGILSPRLAEELSDGITKRIV